MDGASASAVSQCGARGVALGFGDRFFDDTRLELDSRCLLSSADPGGGSTSMSIPMKASLLVLSPGSGIASSLAWLGYYYL